ncbi:MAG: leucine--tRNA ligase [Clostridiales bacterium]|jgi:leucyl-tRNA synthetase|nr:leucine--tRNA ligase [Clostridiales bacterium]
MQPYRFKEVEKKWRAIWEEKKSFKAEDFSSKPKYYILTEFFGPSGKGIHLGHVKCFTPTEVIARYKRLKGFNVLYPAGWDAFGLPTENYAIKTGEQPEAVTNRNIGVFKRQLKRMGYSFDWDREINTSDPGYYRWTQWIFLRLFKNGLAYKAEGLVNFCPHCMTTLSNEDSQGGVCDRCHGEVTQEKRNVWYLRMKDYSEKILAGVEDIDMKESLKEAQRNWIGKSVGGEVDFSVTAGDEKITVFTTRPDTLFGATFVVVAPEHPLIEKLKANIKNIDDIMNYKKRAASKTAVDRSAGNEKTGVEIDGVKAVHPFTNEAIPIYAADYIMMGYGTGAVMAVPAHDERDYEFAKLFGAPIKEVISGGDISREAYAGDGVLVNSDFLNGCNVEAAKIKMTERLEETGRGRKMINYKMRDWPFNRQRYWGEPFPIVICDECGYVPLDEEDLPLSLPKTDDFAPDAAGNGPLSKINEWKKCVCPKCKKPAVRETDTMPNWAGSSWYWLRFMDPKNDKDFVSREKLEYWGAVDLYTGGVEHVTRHMLYASFWHNFLYDIGEVPHKLPFKRRMCNGLILDETGKKMSKSSNNSIDPLDVVERYGADAFRIYILFIGEYELNTLWSLKNISGVTRFLNAVWMLREITDDRDIVSDKHAFTLNAALKKYEETIADSEAAHNAYADHNDFKFNTIIAAMMTFVNEIKADGYITREEFRRFLIMLNPFAPHMTSEIYENLFGKDIMDESFPDYDASKLTVSAVQLPVQVNGKLRSVITIGVDAPEAEALGTALEALSLDRANVKKVIYKANKIINIIM